MSRDDVIRWARGERPAKIISKETLNHPGLIRAVTGLDPFAEAERAFPAAYRALGIDLVNRVPLEPAPEPLPPGEVRRVPGSDYAKQALGVYDSVMRMDFPCRMVNEVWAMDFSGLRYEDLRTPVPHPCKAADIAARSERLGDAGLYFPMLYTTLFMWAVEVLGWEIFMMAALTEPERFHGHFLRPCAEQSRRIVGEMVETDDSPFIFLHDDLADARGPVFPMQWYRDWIFPEYQHIFEPARAAGCKVILVADGNMAPFLEQLAELGVDGLMFETPATPLEPVIEVFGQPGRFLIGGIDTTVLTHGSPEDVQRMVDRVADQCGDLPGFAIASSGGLHGNIPAPNWRAYFRARATHGMTPADWDHCVAMS